MPEIAELTSITLTTVRESLLRGDISPKSYLQGTKSSKKRGSGKVRGNPPYGFRYVRGRLVSHPQEFETLRLLLRWTKQGHTYEQVSAPLNADKLRPRRALAWSRFTVREIAKWHEANPEIITKREGKVISYQPWSTSEDLKRPALAKPNAKGRNQNGT
jgi:hypothetical protein